MLFKKPSILVTSKLPGNALEAFGEDYKIKSLAGKRAPDKKELKKLFAKADGAITLLSDQIDETVLTGSKVKIIANYAVGYNNIDIKTASEKNILVTNTPDVLTDATADLAWALILSAARRIPEGEKIVRSGKFKGWAPELLLGMDLSHKTIGIVGMGRIGRAVARRALAFGMKIVYADSRRLLPSEEEPYGAKFVDLETLLKDSDIVSLHCPLTDETRRILGRDRLFSMRKGAVLINTARGPIVDEEALAEALESHLFAAGLDVYEKEPEVHPALLKMKNAVLLPHIGSAGRETREEMARMAVNNIIAFFDGKVPPNLIPEQVTGVTH
ncbi:MAG TPA: D-glycerate dehydrogenase [Acidobacteriota bacterium]|nr:D-glycerate dehydrogenase [Acidobacteriota bacterium]HNT17789.1 D-glycerate dehydrogenase [Acidobacteriota bacterium]